MIKPGISIKDLLNPQLVRQVALLDQSNDDENFGGAVYNLNKFTFNPSDQPLAQKFG